MCVSLASIRQNEGHPSTPLTPLINYKNRKYVPCFYQAIETQVEVWENKKCCWNMSRQESISKTSTSLSLTQRNTMSIYSTSISLRKQQDEKRKQFVDFNYQQVNSLCLQHHNIKF